MKVRFFTFEQYHGKNGIGSTQIRVHNLIKYWEDADIYKYGEKPDVMIFQKVYMQADYEYPKHLDCIKILDICDPEWLEKQHIKQTVDAVDAVTCPTEALADFIKQLTDKPVRVIKDRFDLAVIPTIQNISKDSLSFEIAEQTNKQHKDKAKKIVWFGYKQNAELIKPAFDYLMRNDYELTIISNDDPFIRHEYQYQFKKYDEDTIYQELQKHDICLLPAGMRPEDRFKSDNKTMKARLAGIPVAKTADDLEALIDPNKRQAEAELWYNKAKSQADCRISVKEMQELIEEIKNAKTK